MESAVELSIVGDPLLVMLAISSDSMSDIFLFSFFLFG